MTFDEFLENYTLVHNFYAKDRPFEGKMFETTGREFEFVKSKLHNKQVWTVVDGDNGEMYVLPGFHLVNRVGYFITEEVYDEKLTEILID
jgi:hypothetical protein